jgi:hypothetical protein
MTQGCIDVGWSSTSDLGTLQVFQDLSDLLSLTLLRFQIWYDDSPRLERVKRGGSSICNRFLYSTPYRSGRKYFCMCSAWPIEMYHSARLLLLASRKGKRYVLTASPVQKSWKQEARICAASKAEREIKITSHDVSNYPEGHERRIKSIVPSRSRPQCFAGASIRTRLVTCHASLY